ncbi:MAG: hypothetical protein ACYSR4_07285 [Planctomycetota bacterium]|jgi:hypothetical protein
MKAIHAKGNYYDICAVLSVISIILLSGNSGAFGLDKSRGGDVKMPPPIEQCVKEPIRYVGGERAYQVRRRVKM